MLALLVAPLIWKAAAVAGKPLKTHTLLKLTFETTDLVNNGEIIFRQGSDIMSSILFDNPRATFVRVCKTGSTSIVRGIFGGITDLDSVRREPPPKAWLQNFSFAFVRNPFDRLVSAYLMFRKYRTSTQAEQEFQSRMSIGSLLDFLKNDDRESDDSIFYSKLRSHIIPMSHPSYGLERISNVFRFERFSAAFVEICTRLNIRKDGIPHFRKTSRDAYECYFNTREKRLARQLLQEDCDRFGYSF